MATLAGVEPSPMLASASASVPVGPEWAFEPKWDGWRTLIAVGPDGRLRMTSRRGSRWESAFPELAAVGRSLPVGTVLDGETIVMGPDARPDFASLSTRLHGRRPAGGGPQATFVAFDVLVHEGEPTIGRPYVDRRALLESLGFDGERMALTMASDDGDALFSATGDLGVEGIVAKRRASRYVCGRRSRAWLKVKHRQSGWFDVTGWRLASRRHHYGGIMLADEGRPAGTAIPALPAPMREALHRLLERHGRLLGDRVVFPLGVQVRVEYLERSTTGVVREGVARELRPRLPG